MVTFNEINYGMNKTWLLMLVVLTVILPLFGCEKDCSSPMGFYGEWEWIRTFDNHNGVTTTPEDLGYTEHLSVGDFIFRQFINDSLVFESQYDLLIRTDSLGKSKNFLVFPSGYEREISVDGNELALTETWLLVNPTSYYTRK